VTPPGAGGVFNIDLSLQASNAAGNQALSAANGYIPFFNDVTAPTFGPGSGSGRPRPGRHALDHPGCGRWPPGEPGRRVPAQRGESPPRPDQTFNDWQVGLPGFFGTNVPSTLTAYVVQGTAPGVIPAGGLTPISNVVHETFTIGG
jgi:hypothetical protein